MINKIRFNFIEIRRQKKSIRIEQKVHLIIDASGVGFGGLRYFLDKVIANISSDENLSVLVIGSNLDSNQVGVTNRWKLLFHSAYKLIRLRKTPNSVLFSISPSICSLTWFGKPIIQNINDLQSFLPKVRINLFKRAYRWAVYSLVLRIASGITSISYETKGKIPELFRVKKKINVIYLSGELSSAQKLQSYDFLIVAHSRHKRADYILELLSHEKFRGKSVAILGREYSQAKMLTCGSFVKNLQTFYNLSDDDYADLFYSSKSIVMFSEIGSEGFGLPIAQAIYAKKNSFISQDPALMEVSKGCSSILFNDVNADRNTLANLPREMMSQENVFMSRSWKDVADDFLRYILMIYQDSSKLKYKS